jgi:phage RecT family recombinase
MPTAAAPAPNTERGLTKIEGVKQALDLRADDIQKVLPPGMDAQRFTRVALLAVSKNPDLLECTPTSIIRSIVEAAEVGLEPTGSLNRAWLVPFRENANSPKEAQLMIGYQGYADLIRDSGKITRLTAEVVYNGDIFRVYKGTETPRIVHTPRYKTEDPSEITYAYAVAWFADGGVQFEVMTRQQVELIRAKSRQRNGTTWTQNWPQMARKTVVRRIANYLPLGERVLRGGLTVAEVLARDDEREFGEGQSTAVSSGAAHVRERIRNRRGAQPEEVAPAPEQEPETSAGQAVVVSEDSADGQTDAAAEPIAQATVEGVCGAGSDPKLGDVETCVLAPGHTNPDETPSAHKGASGAVWPNREVRS